MSDTWKDFIYRKHEMPKYQEAYKKFVEENVPSVRHGVVTTEKFMSTPFTEGTPHEYMILLEKQIIASHGFTVGEGCSLSKNERRKIMNALAEYYESFGLAYNKWSAIAMVKRYCSVCKENAPLKYTDKKPEGYTGVVYPTFNR
ncbi:MAG: hypothetical protein KGI29_09390 [Pseudomonadota bacterium]|nr:hypothetical protein [Pseudomonadota bacterium]MDE3038240.1 hypothetical protein [Pseudomonadota bacterium]